MLRMMMGYGKGQGKTGLITFPNVWGLGMIGAGVRFPDLEKEGNHQIKRREDTVVRSVMNIMSMKKI